MQAKWINLDLNDLNHMCTYQRSPPYGNAQKNMLIFFPVNALMANAGAANVSNKAKTKVVEKVVEKVVNVDDPEGMEREKEEIRQVCPALHDLYIFRRV